MKGEEGVTSKQRTEHGRRESWRGGKAGRKMDSNEGIKTVLRKEGGMEGDRGVT